MNSFVDVWENVCDFCQNSIHEVAYNTWIKTLNPVEFKDDTAVISSRSDYQKQIVEQHYMDLLTKGFEQVFGFPVKVSIIVSGMAIPTTAAMPAKDQARYTFDNFVVGPSNKFAHAAALAVAKNPATQYNPLTYNPLTIYGDPGLGKTHLLNAIRNYISAQNPNLKIIYTQGEPFMNEIIEAIQNVETSAFREKYRKADVLILDDIQFIAGKESTQMEFFNTFEALYQDHKQIILASDRHPKDIQSLEERIQSRMIMGLTADIGKPDFETRVQIIRRKANALQFEIPDVIVQYIANQLKKDGRQLEGIVNKLYAYYQLTGEKPTLTSAGNLVTEIRNDDLPQPVTFDRIVSHVAANFDVSAADICSSKQNAEVADARHVAIYVTREITGKSLKEIGHHFGRNHSTVSASIKKVEGDMKRNPRLRAIVEDIIKNVSNA